jgi:hypothetical protein
VEFHPRQVDGAAAHSATHAAHGPAAETGPEAFQLRLRRLVAQHPEMLDLPRWRQADLPESHRAFYPELAAGASGVPASFMNGPTQCSTCHQ